METRVRYVVTGLFALATLLASIFFILWLQHAGTMRGRQALILRFNGPAMGLRVGAPVSFNGIRIGEVTKLSFDPADPNAVIARLMVQSIAPISRDTIGEVDTQGLVGNAQVSFHGGSPEERITWRNGPPPVIEAQISPSLTQEARTALSELRGVVSDNAQPLKNVIANVEMFSTALARNSDKVDTILADLEKLTGGKQNAPRIFDLEVPDLPALPESQPAQVSIAAGLVMFDTQKLLVTDGKGEIIPSDLQWSDTTPKLVQRKLVQALDTAGMRYPSAGGDAAVPDVSVQTEVRAFQIVRMPRPHAQITLAMRISGSDGKVVNSRVFSAEAPAKAEDGPQAAEAMSGAFAKVIAQAAPWIAQAVADRPSGLEPLGPETPAVPPGGP